MTELEVLNEILKGTQSLIFIVSVIVGLLIVFLFVLAWGHNV